MVGAGGDRAPLVRDLTRIPTRRAVPMWPDDMEPNDSGSGRAASVTGMAGMCPARVFSRPAPARSASVGGQRLGKRFREQKTGS